MYLIVFCSVLLILLWLFQVVFLDSFYRYIKINEVKNTAKSLSNNIDNANFNDIVQEIGASNEVCIEILSESGATLFTCDTLKDCLIHKMPKMAKYELAIKTIDNGGELLQYFPDKNHDGYDWNRPNGFNNEKQSIIYTKIMKNKLGETQIVFINSVISPVSATVKTITIQFNIIATVMLVFSIIMAFLIAKKVSKPIVKINEGAKILAKGEYNIEFSGTGYREINELTKTLNYTAAELSKVDSLRNELIANVSHDLRTPLTLISGYAEVMRDLPLENNPENAQIIIDESKRLSMLVNDILDISKINSGTQTLNTEKFNLTEEIKRVTETMSELTKINGYSVSFEYTEEAFVCADKLKISQAFYNLLTNAINYTGEDKKVIVKQIIFEKMVRIEVCDSGEGIDAESLPYIWERYYKVDKTHKRAITGTGLGLSIVKSIFEMHNGEYGVISKKGEGSTFWFQIPLE